jgi:hypothetical protein
MTGIMGICGLVQNLRQRTVAYQSENALIGLQEFHFAGSVSDPVLR